MAAAVAATAFTTVLFGDGDIVKMYAGEIAGSFRDYVIGLKCEEPFVKERLRGLKEEVLVLIVCVMGLTCE